MRVIRAPSIGRAHEQVIKMILEKGWILRTEDAEATVEFEEIAIQVDTPLAEPMTSPHSKFQKRFVEQYARDLIHGSHANFEYDYHGRLFDWGERLVTEGRPVHVDQIAYIVDKLRSQPETRRAVAITWNPVIDEKLDDCPCLQLVQCIVRDNKLHMRVIFRSNDMLTAAGANMYALCSSRNISQINSASPAGHTPTSRSSPISTISGICTTSNPSAEKASSSSR